ncbi:MAG: hypothetical protein RLZZ303_1264 [Candidatus Hydrogenedentota bacterium]
MGKTEQYEVQRHKLAAAFRGGLAFGLPAFVLFTFGIFVHLGKATDYFQLTAILWPHLLLLVGIYFAAHVRADRLYISVVLTLFGSWGLPAAIFVALFEFPESVGNSFWLPQWEYLLNLNVWLGAITFATSCIVMAVWCAVNRRNVRAALTSLVAVLAIAALLPGFTEFLYAHHHVWTLESLISTAWILPLSGLNPYRFFVFMSCIVTLVLATCILLSRWRRDHRLWAVVPVIALSAIIIFIICSFVPHFSGVPSLEFRGAVNAYRKILSFAGSAILVIWTITGMVVGTLLSTVPVDKNVTYGR